MLKSTIIDTSVRIIPSEELITFLKAQTTHEGCMPENIKKILNQNKVQKVPQETEKIEPVKFNQKELNALRELNETKDTSKSNKQESVIEENSGVENISESPQLVKDVPVEPDVVTEKIKPDTRHFIINSDLKWIFNLLQERRKTDPDIPYLNELLKGSKMVLPENHFVERNPVLEERCKKLRKEQEQREYNKMTKNVDNVRKRDPEDTIGYQSKSLVDQSVYRLIFFILFSVRAINSQLIAILQFVFSVAAGFAFGFIGIALIVGDLDFGFRLLLGIMFALIIALAEIYFLAKKLNEEYEVKPEGPIYNDYGTGTTSKAKKDN